MELRSDIAAAAARMTSGYDVNREIRQLGAYLWEGETVQRVTSGVYGTGTGLLAVTDHRVLLLRDGRSGQASEGFPLERLSSAEWVAEGARGTIVISDANSVAELRDVAPTEGEEIIGYVHALMSSSGAQTQGQRWPEPNGSHVAPSMPAVHTTPVQVAPPAAIRPHGVPTGIPAGATPPRGTPLHGGPAAGSGPRGGPAPAIPPRGNPAPATPPPGTPAAASHGTPPSGVDALPPGAVPVSLLASTDAIPSQQQPDETPVAATPGPARVTPPHSESDHAAGGPGLMAGEVPISQLATEPAFNPLPPADLADDADATVGAAPVGAPEHTGEPATSASGERPTPITWRVPPKTPSGPPRPSESEITSIRPPTRVEATSKPAKSGPGRADAKRKKWIWLGVGAAGLISLAAIGSAKLVAPEQPHAAAPVSPTPAAVDSTAGPVVMVTKVIDGDTVEVTGQELNGPVEVLGIVAPRVDKNQCGATTAKAYAVRTLLNTQVTLVTDPSQPPTDRSGHKLAFLRLPNGSDYSVLAVGAGMARYYESPQPVMTANEIKAAETAAQSKREGMWGPPCNVKPTATGETSSGGTGGASGSGANAPRATQSAAGTHPSATRPAQPVSSTGARSG